MARFTDQERAEIFRRSRELLEDKPPVTPSAPAPEPPLVLEDNIAKWKREADEASALRQATRDAMQHQQRADTRTHGVDWWSAINLLERRLVAVEQTLTAYDALAHGVQKFSDAVSTKLHEIETLTLKLDATFKTMHAVHERQVENLRAQLANSEKMRSRELALVTKQLADTQRALDQASAHRERTHDREHVAALGAQVGNVVQLLREDLANRNGAA